MRPSAPVADALNDASGDTEARGDVVQSAAVLVDRQRGRISNGGRWVALAFGHSRVSLLASALDHVRHVVGLRSGPKVTRVAAGGVVAVMPDNFTGQKRPNEYLERSAVREEYPISEGYFAVASPVA